MTNDPILQELLAEFDEKTRGKMPSDMTLVTISRPEWENFLEEVKSFLTSVVHRTRERTLVEAMSVVPERALPPITKGKEYLEGIVAGWDNCRAATLEALNALREEK